MVRGEYPSVKLVLIGDPAVGKTSIRRKYMGETFKEDYLSTIGAEVSYAENDKLNLTIWDLAGEPNFESVRITFYAGTRTAILVFDVTRPDTLTALSHWMREMLRYTSNDIPLIIVGNKIDLVDDITSQEIHQQFQIFLSEFPDDINLYRECVYTSAKTGNNIESMFDTLSDMVLETL